MFVISASYQYNYEMTDVSDSLYWKYNIPAIVPAI